MENKLIQISVVIPCRNEAPYIQECIEAIYNSDLEDGVQLNVFVTDGMSNDGTREIVHQLQERYSTLKLVDNQKQLTPFAFNLGMHARAFDFLQIVGARHIISSNYIQNCLTKLMTDSETWCVGGKIINEFMNDQGRLIASAMGTAFGMGLGNFRTLSSSGFTDTVTSPMYPSWVFDKIGYFDEELIRNQDDDFNFRVTNAGGKIYFDADISLKYYVRGNFKNLWKQFFQYGYWKVYVNKKHKAVTTLRQLVPPLFVVYLFLMLLTPMISVTLTAIFVIPFLIYLILAVYFSFKVVKEDTEISLFKVFQTFPILHVSYGLGYLKGILEFVVLWKKPSEKQKELSR